MSLFNEIFRKSLHLLLLVIPFTYLYLGKWESLAIFAPITAIIVAIDYLRQKFSKINLIFSKIFNAILRENEKSGTSLCGASFVGIATCINFLLFEKEIAIIGFIILAISDALAAIIGKSIKSRPFYEKSMAGSAAFFISALTILIICGIQFKVEPWFYAFGLFAVFSVTMIEARPSLAEINDNFAIPIGFALIMTFFDIAWNYNF